MIALRRPTLDLPRCICDVDVGWRLLIGLRLIYSLLLPGAKRISNIFNSYRQTILSKICDIQSGRYSTLPCSIHRSRSSRFISRCFVPLRSCCVSRFAMSSASSGRLWSVSGLDQKAVVVGDLCWEGVVLLALLRLGLLAIA